MCRTSVSFVISAPRKISRCDMDWIETKGRAPQKREQPYWLLFRNGKESKQPYTAKQMQWGHHRKGMDDDYDIVAVRKE